ncbi:MAG TPA: hypothetical protein VNJ28_08785 [Candidatus Limnocylindrales bacterium]|nr:hypothetical protein [Candidatus Limnocylindrales bacterium]
MATQPLSVQVIAYAPTVFTHCQHCEVTFAEVGLGERLRREAAASALPDDLALEFARLSDWVRRLVDRFGSRIHVKVVDAASIEGVLLSLRHGVWRYPAVIVGGRDKRVGSKFEEVEPIIERHLSAPDRGSRPGGQAA